MATTYTVNCACGVAITELTVDELVVSTQAHAAETHELALTESDIRDMMSIDAA